MAFTRFPPFSSLIYRTICIFLCQRLVLITFRMNKTMKKLIVIRGPLGVGKSTVSKLLEEKLGANYLSLDKILEDNDLEAEDGIPLENFLKANELILELVNKSEKSYIIDGCFYYQEQIDDLKQKFEDDIIIFSLTSSVEKCILRDSKRAKVFGEDSARYVHMITTKIKEGIEIDNTDLTVKETVEKIHDFLK